MNSKEIYTEVTNAIIELLEDHKLTWNKPWISLSGDNDYNNNPFSHQYYKGINQFLLSLQSMKKGYLRSQWATFSQIKKMEGQALKGAKSTPVIFYKTAFIDKHKKYYKPETVDKMSKARIAQLGIDAVPIVKFYRVFNLQAQTKNLDPAFYEIKTIDDLTAFEKDESAENLLRSSGATIIEKPSNRAYYNRARDEIILPLRKQFNGSKENFYDVALHELGHFTGHPSRLNRTFGKFGDPDYAKEELVAELFSAYYGAYLGFSQTITNNAAYIGHWLGILNQDPNAIVSIASQAQKAFDYVLAQASSTPKISQF